MAVDHNGVSGHCGVFAERRTESKPGVCAEPGAGLRNGVARLLAASTAGADGCGIPGGIHVNGWNAAQLGLLISGERPLQALSGSWLDRAPLRTGGPSVHGIARAGER